MLKQFFKVLPYLGVALVVMALVVFVEAISMLKMMELIDIAFNSGGELFKQKAIELMGYALIMVPLTLLSAVVKGWYKRAANLKLKHYYVEGVFGKNINEFHRENNARYISSLTNDCNVLDQNLIESLYVVCFAILQFLAGIWMMTTVSPWVLLVGLVVVILNVLVSVFTAKPIAKHNKERSDLFDEYTSYIKEVLSAFQIIKSNNLQERITKSFKKQSKSVQEKGYIIDKIFSYMQALQLGTANIAMFGIMLVSGYMALTGVITIGGTLVVLQGIQRMIWPIFMMAETVPKLFTVKEIIAKMNQSLENEEVYKEHLRLEDFKEHIKLDHVSFGYDEDMILEDINLEFKKGGKYLIVGPSGGGKSTLLRLLRKYFNPVKGKLQIDGQILKDIKKEDFFSLVANVEQQVFLFEDTLKNNITLYKDYTNEEIENAIEKAGLKEFVEALPNGLETMIYENGRNISGGERSRIVIARGLLAKAKIIFLDEAFAALDLERAKEIEQSILALKDVTVINVSHVIFESSKAQYDGVLKVNHGQVEFI